MTAKEKALQLHQKFFLITPKNLSYLECLIIAKQSAIIAVDEMMFECENWSGGSMILGWDNNRFHYLQEVKQEIEKI